MTFCLGGCEKICSIWPANPILALGGTRRLDVWSLECSSAPASVVA